MKRIAITFACFLLTASALFAQHAKFITSGTIAYEKSVNVYAIVKKMMTGNNMQGLNQQVFEQFQKTQPQFKVLKSTLTFNNDKTLFTPIPFEGIASNFFGAIPMAEQKNLIYTDLAASNITEQKTFYDETFLVKDSTRKINWKITDETREIAGYTCRRANALVLDSIYVVAFYTNEIHVSGGPEQFSGLPGMILEVAVPHENVIWRATKITDVAVPVTAIVPPKKGKIMNNKQLHDTIMSLIKNWGTSKQMDLMIKDLFL
jgi:GLPGLI family protein